MDRVVIVTGVSTGIGNATARVLIGKGYRVFGSVRKREDADRLAADLGAGFVPLLFDVTHADEVQQGAEEARRLIGQGKVVGLVNNAGIVVPGPLIELPPAELRRQLEVNLVSVLTVTQAFMPLLREAGVQDGRRPRIINMSSIAGKLALPFVGPYTTAKHGLEGLSDALRRELVLYGVDVVKIDPGNVATPIWDKADALDISPYTQSPYYSALIRTRTMMVSMGHKGSPPERVGRLVLKALTARNPRPLYVIGSGFAAWMIRHVIPTRTADRLITATYGIRRGS